MRARVPALGACRPASAFLAWRLTLLLCGLEVAAVSAEGTQSERLKAAGRLGVADADCVAAENKLGQLLYVNADGFGKGSARAIDPEYLRLAAELGLGGVLPHFGTKDVREIRKAALALRQATTSPLLLGVDYVDVELGDVAGRVGLGWGGGLIGAYGGKLDDACLDQAAYLQGFLHRALGLNHALGPTVDRGRRLKDAGTEAAALRFLDGLRTFGTAATLKHFPYLPAGHDLHADSLDTEDSREAVATKTLVFRNLAGKADFVMTTHLINSQVDPELVTFSPEWIGRLRRDAGFDGVIVTDALLMIARYKSLWPSIVAAWGREEAVRPREGVSIYAARALLAGHDMVLLEGTASNTRRVFADLHYIACQDTAHGKALRSRITESYERVTAYKERNRAALTWSAAVPEPLIREALELHAAFATADGRSPAPTERARAACARQRGSFAEFRNKARPYEAPAAAAR